MIRCFALYKETLGETYDTDSDRHKALSKTHKKLQKLP